MKKTVVVPVSGGKDSQVCVCLALEKHSRDDLRFVHQNTGYDHPLTYAHLAYMEERYSINIEHTRSTKYGDVFGVIEKTGYFPSSVARSCTSRLKQHPFADWLRDNNLLAEGACHVYMGMRSDESATRASKYGELTADDIFTLPELSREYGKAFQHVLVTLPIVEWDTARVFTYLAARGDAVNGLYAKGHHRVGCYPCLLARNAEWEAAARDDVGRTHIKKLLDIEDKFKAENNPRKLIKVHATRDVRGLYERNAPLTPSDDSECGWCSI